MLITTGHLLKQSLFPFLHRPLQLLALPQLGKTKSNPPTPRPTTSELLYSMSTAMRPWGPTLPGPSAWAFPGKFSGASARTSSGLRPPPLTCSPDPLAFLFLFECHSAQSFLKLLLFLALPGSSSRAPVTPLLCCF